jgi:outer membrane receptor for ferrienterochelin and colicins
MNAIQNSTRIFLIFLSLSFFSGTILAQNTLHVNVTNKETGEPIPGAVVQLKKANLATTTDAKGNAILKNIPGGRQQIVISFLGYKNDTLVRDFPVVDTSMIYIIQLEEGEELNDIIVSSTRTNSRIEDEPMKVEVIGSEEVEEKYTMKPGNISMLLTETTGLQAEHTSVTTGNINFRIQGLDGKYTQVLKDGLPLFGEFSGNLGLMQTPPLDLKQVEIIKGSASTLFGGDAIAGAVNLISKEPGEHDEFNMLLNQTSLQGTDIASFYSKRKDKLGITFLASASTQNARDVNGDGIADLPQSRQFTINPKLFYYFNDSTKLMAGFSSGYDNRVGGNIVNIFDKATSFQTFNEINISYRNYTQLRFEKKFNNGSILTVKNSFNIFNRDMTGYHQFFAGEQVSSYSEASYLWKLKNNDLVIGLNYLTDAFKEIKPSRDSIPTCPQNRSYTYNTIGAFLQDDWHVTDRFVAEGGLRADYQNRFGKFLLPHVSLMYTFSPAFLVRLGGGYGYKIPSVFTDYSEHLGYNYVNPVDPAQVKAETSRGVNMDFNFKIFRLKGNDIYLTINQSFFYTEIKNPVVPTFNDGIHTVYLNAGKDIVSKGFTTNLNFIYKRMNFVAGYTYTDARRLYDSVNQTMPLSARHLINFDLVYDDHKHWKIGLEGYYIGPQITEDYSRKRDYWLAGALLSYSIKNFTFSLNFENLLDIRQTRYESLVYTQFPPMQVTYRDLWAPLDGRVGNLSVKITI